MADSWVRDGQAEDYGSGLLAEKEVRKHFSNKRLGMRCELNIPIEVQGTHGRLGARIVNISRSGALLWLHDPRFVPTAHSANLVAVAQRLDSHFSQGIAVHFVSQAVSYRANVVRLTQRELGSDEPVLVACKFTRPLSDPLCDIIGIAAVEDQLLEED